MDYRYEEHNIFNNQLPFVFHRDKVTSMSAALPNFHTNIELLFCFEGRGTAVCGTNKFDFGPGDIIVVNSNVLHKVTSDDYVRYYCLIIDKSFCDANGIDIATVYFNPFITDYKARELYNKICTSYSLNSENKVLRIRYFVLGLLVYLVDNYSSRISAKDYKSDLISAERIKKVVEYIQSNLNSSITLDDISSYVGVSKFYLSRDFKRFTGNTIFEYINISRCKTAAALIASGMTVSLAANACGFENLSYFSKTYKKYIGKLPSDRR